MAHLIDPIRNESIKTTIAQLEAAHAFIGKQLRRAHMRHFCIDKSNFGVLAKRIKIKLTGKGKPNIIGKSEENYIEAINMTATLERLISALKWIQRQQHKQKLTALHCHPSTSSDRNINSNDLIIVDEHGNENIRCEVSDVVSKNPNQNNKELRDLKSLGCETQVPNDGVKRFLCVSPEFAEGLTNPNRNWSTCHYRYKANDTEDSTGSIMLQVLDKSNAT